MLKTITKIAIGLSIATSTQAQTFVEANSLTGFNNTFTGVFYSSIAFSDVNSDGKPDVLITGTDPSLVPIAKLYTNSGSNFSEVLSTPFDGVVQSSIAFSDVNSDGKPDVLITGHSEYNGYTAKLYTNSGSNFSEVLGTPFDGVTYGSIAFSDVNSDGKPDVLITGESAQSDFIAKLYTNSGTNFSEVLGTPFDGVNYGSIAFSDVNGDGKPDVLITGQNSSYTYIAKLYTNTGTNFSEVLGTPFTGVDVSSVAFSDVNSNGKPDVLITGGSSSGIIAKLYTNSGTNFSEVLGTPFAGAWLSSIAFSDVNADGKSDVLITGGGANSLFVSKLYTNSGTNFSEVLETPFDQVQTSSIAFSDVNLDGKPDVLITGWDGYTPIAKLYLNQFIFPTLIVSQPASTTVCGGTLQSFVVSASGENLSYLWSNNATTTSINTSVAGTYFVTVTGNGGQVVSNAVTLNSCSVTGISSSIATYSFEIYPNPNGGSFVIDVPSFENLEHLSFIITAIDGKVLATGKLTAGKNTFEINFPKGFYFVKVGSTTKKLIIE